MLGAVASIKNPVGLSELDLLNTQYVNRIFGSDANDGKTINRAKQTIQAAIDALPTGVLTMVHILGGGQYVENIVAPVNSFLTLYGPGVTVTGSVTGVFARIKLAAVSGNGAVNPWAVKITGFNSGQIEIGTVSTVAGMANAVLIETASACVVDLNTGLIEVVSGAVAVEAKSCSMTGSVGLIRSPGISTGVLASGSQSQANLNVGSFGLPAGSTMYDTTAPLSAVSLFVNRRSTGLLENPTGTGTGKVTFAGEHPAITVGSADLDQLQILYVAKSGLDTNDGLSVNKPFLTIQRAVDELPVTGLRAIQILDGGTYAEDIVIPNNLFVKLDGPLAIVSGSITGDWAKINLSSIGATGAVNAYAISMAGGAPFLQATIQLDQLILNPLCTHGIIFDKAGCLTNVNINYFQSAEGVIALDVRGCEIQGRIGRFVGSGPAVSTLLLASGIGAKSQLNLGKVVMVSGSTLYDTTAILAEVSMFINKADSGLLENPTGTGTGSVMIL